MLIKNVVSVFATDYLVKSMWTITEYHSNKFNYNKNVVKYQNCIQCDVKSLQAAKSYHHGRLAILNISK